MEVLGTVILLSPLIGELNGIEESDIEREGREEYGCYYISKLNYLSLELYDVHSDTTWYQFELCYCLIFLLHFLSLRILRTIQIRETIGKCSAAGISGSINLAESQKSIFFLFSVLCIYFTTFSQAELVLVFTPTYYDDDDGIHYILLTPHRISALEPKWQYL